MWVGFFLLLYQTQTPNPSPLVFSLDFGVFKPDFGVIKCDFGVFKLDFGVIKCEFGVKICVKFYGKRM